MARVTGAVSARRLCRALRAWARVGTRCGSVVTPASEGRGRLGLCHLDGNLGFFFCLFRFLPNLRNVGTVLGDLLLWVVTSSGGTAHQPPPHTPPPSRVALIWLLCSPFPPGGSRSAAGAPAWPHGCTRCQESSPAGSPSLVFLCIVTNKLIT